MEPSVTINDKRGEKDFKGVSFSKFKKTDVKKELLNSLLHSKIEPACYWSAELICSGNYGDLWELIIQFFSKFVHLGNSNIASYLEMRMNDFKSIYSQGFTGIELSMRNDSRIRQLFCEIMCVLCDSKRRHSYDKIKIKPDDLNMIAIRDKFNAPSTSYAENVYLEEDPKVLFPFINELAYCVTTEGNNQMHACFWIEWIVEFEGICKEKKEKIQCERRTLAKVEFKFQKEIIWMIWDVFLKESTMRTKFIQKIIKSVLSLFCFKYTSGAYKKRKNLLYLAISLLCEPFVPEKEIIRHAQKDLVLNIINKIDLVYGQIKDNEETCGTDYLFMGMKSTNLENTIAKLDKMNSFGETFVPRI